MGYELYVDTELPLEYRIDRETGSIEVALSGVSDWEFSSYMSIENPVSAFDRAISSGHLVAIHSEPK